MDEVTFTEDGERYSVLIHQGKVLEFLRDAGTHWEKLDHEKWHLERGYEVVYPEQEEGEVLQ